MPWVIIVNYTKCRGVVLTGGNTRQQAIAATYRSETLAYQYETAYKLHS